MELLVEVSGLLLPLNEVQHLPTARGGGGEEEGGGGGGKEQCKV